MGEIEEGLERAMRTKPIPVHLATRVKFLWDKVAKEDTDKLAQAAGVSVRTAQRWVKALKQGQVPHMTKANEKKVEQAVRQRWQPRVKNRVRRAAETQGFQVSGRAYFGFRSAAGSTDDPRERDINQWLPGDVAHRLFDARDAGATERQQQQIIADGLGEYYFRQRGTRASGLDVEMNDVVYLDFGIDH